MYVLHNRRQIRTERILVDSIKDRTYLEKLPRAADAKNPNPARQMSCKALLFVRCSDSQENMRSEQT